ncbi:MAG: GNAT family N-acetyltransferase, partial [Mycobacterium sp.]
MEPLTTTRPAVRVATADSIDIAELSAVAALTFPLACPASATPANIASFIEANLSAVRFAEYLADPQ